MKKTFFLIAVAILLGTITGKVLYSKYDNTQQVFNETNMAYFLQEGVYETESSLMRNTKDITPKVVIHKKNKYYVYIGISKSLDGINKIKKIYTKKGYSVVLKQKQIDNDNYMINLDQYDILLENATSTNDILAIQEVVLSNYEELIK